MQMNFLLDSAYFECLFFTQIAEFTLSDLRDCVANTRCSDPRDWVYGILNLPSRGGRLLGIMPDYKKTVDEVYEDSMRRHLFEADELNILQNCHGQTSFNLPSWIPDWSNIAEQPLDLKHTMASGSLKGIHSITQLNHLRIYETVLHMLRDKELSTSYVCGGDI